MHRRSNTRSPTCAGGARGLGLHLVAQVTRLHRGRLTIGSSESGGAKMGLELNLDV